MRFTLLVAFFLSVCIASQAVPASHYPDTIWIRYASTTPVLKWHYRYDQTLVMKLMMSQALFDGKYKRLDNGQSQTFVNFQEALEIIKRIDHITVGIPKIIYLVGWQYNGHDSKYPAWFEGNEKLKRPQDANSIESLKWLMHEAKKYHTIVSLHINMFDAYEDSPLWDIYVKNDIIAKNKDGSVLPGEWGYPISYAQEWKMGFARKRIDSICKLIPLKNAHTIHIDAFHTWPPLPVKDKNGNMKVDLSKKITSPYLNFTVADETEAQQKIFEYWHSKGIDVTSEGVSFLRETDFQGYQPMGWWFSGLENYLRYPSDLYTGGSDPTVWGRLFGTSMHGEDLVKKDQQQLAGYKEQFCLKTAIWYYLNRLDRKYVVNTDTLKSVGFSDNVRTILTRDQFFLVSNKDTLVRNDDMLLPAPWKGKDYFLLYSKQGYNNKKWVLPGDKVTASSASLYNITVNGSPFVGRINVSNKIIQLSLKPDQMVLLKLATR